jgi:hypothetical protein
MLSTCAGVGLTQLRDEIREWAALHRRVSRLKAQERAGRTGRASADAAVPMVLLVVAVAFYGLIAYAMVN